MSRFNTLAGFLFLCTLLLLLSNGIARAEELPAPGLRLSSSESDCLGYALRVAEVILPSPKGQSYMYAYKVVVPPEAGDYLIGVFRKALSGEMVEPQNVVATIGINTAQPETSGCLVSAVSVELADQPQKH